MDYINQIKKIASELQSFSQEKIAEELLKVAVELESSKKETDAVEGLVKKSAQMLQSKGLSKYSSRLIDVIAVEKRVEIEDLSVTLKANPLDNSLKVNVTTHGGRQVATAEIPLNTPRV
jgi:hypothetical protein